jgi:hypothetical protein
MRALRDVCKRAGTVNSSLVICNGELELQLFEVPLNNCTITKLLLRTEQYFILMCMPFAKLNEVVI